MSILKTQTKKSRVNMIIILFFLISSISIFGKTLATLNDESDSEPRNILEKSQSKIISLENFTYQAKSFGIGANSNWPHYEGTISVKRGHSSPAIPGLLSIKGKGFNPGNEKPQYFEAAFDGKSVRWRNNENKTITERNFTPNNLSDKDWAKIVGHLGRPFSFLILWPLIDNQPYMDELAADLIEYEGSIAVENELCHILYFEKKDTLRNRTRQWRWFISKNDWLPRKYESVNYIDKRVSGIQTIISELLIETEAKSDFNITIPPGFKIIPYESAKKSKNNVELESKLGVGDMAVDWKAKDSNDNLISLRDFRGKTVLLDFWALWCTPCKKSMPNIQKLYDEYKDGAFAVIGIHCFPQPGIGKPMDYIKRMDYTYLQIPDGHEIAELYNVELLPTYFVIDPEGKIQIIQKGNFEAIEPELKNLLSNNKTRSNYSKIMYKLIEDNKFPELEKKLYEFRKQFKPTPIFRQHLYFETLKLAEFYVFSEDHENVVRIVMDEISTLPFDAPYPSFFLLQYFTNSFLKIYSKAEFCEILDGIKNGLEKNMVSLQKNPSLEDEQIKLLSIYEKIVSNFQKILRRLSLVGTEAPDLSFTHFVNTEHNSIDDFQSNVVLLLFWRTTCGPSLAAFPAINTLFSKYRDREFFTIGVTSFQGQYRDEEISVNDITKNEEMEFIEKLLAKYNVKFPVGLSEKSVFNPDYGITSTPTCVLIDRDGYVRYVSKGLSNESFKEIEEQIQKFVGNES